MYKFAKVFDLKHNQVLIEKNYESAEDSDDGEERFILMQRLSPNDGTKLDMNMGFHNEDSRDKAFEEYNEENAINFVETTRGLFDGAMSDIIKSEKE